MAVNRLNHAVLYVRDAARTATFYEDVFDFDRLTEIPGAIFLRAPGSTNDHDLGLFSVGESAGPSGAGRGTVGLYHLAWEVDTLDDLDQLRTKLVAADALTGQSDHGTTKSLYGHDPDGIELEVVWIVPAALIDARALAAQGGRPQPLDLAGEKARFGATTKGGIGISSPAH